MAKFRGEKNVHLGGEKPWAVSVWDGGVYVVEVSGKDAERFRAVAGEYGFVEDEPPAAKKAVAKHVKGGVVPASADVKLSKADED